MQQAPHDSKFREHTKKHDHRIEHFFRRTLHWIERFIALVTILVMLAAFGYELYRMFLGGTKYLPM